MCTASNYIINENMVSFSGFGSLDIRFGSGCEESVEICCVEPQNVTVPKAVPVKGCGFRNKNGLDFNISGGTGEEALYGEFPWVVALLDAQNQQYIGVGVLVHPQVVLTAAHVVKKYHKSANALQIRAGEWDTQTVKERYPSQERIVQEIFIHQDFNVIHAINDLAILRLQEAVELNQHINVICMPQQGENLDRSTGCVANGWGKNLFGVKGHYSVILKRVDMDMVGREECTNKLRTTRLGRFFRLHESFVCASGKSGRDTCQGDGGAPLACPTGNDDKYKLTGLVSWGIGCGDGTPSVYVNVANYRNLIDGKMAEWGYSTDAYNI